VEQIKFKQGDAIWKRYRRKACTDLWWLCSEVLGYRELVPMREYTHLPMVRFAERKTGIEEIDNARVQIIEMPRGSGKSTLVTNARSVQRFLVDPEYALGIANETQRLAKAFLGNIKAHFEQNELLRALFPDLVPKNFRETIWAADQIVLNRSKHRQEPSVLACGVDATVTGVHMDEWILDDIISREAAENARTGSYTEIEKVNRWLVQLEPLLTTPKRDPITIIGTRWWEGDSYEYARELWSYGEEPREYNWRLKLSDGNTINMLLQRAGDVAIFSRSAIENGKSIFPERYNIDELAKKQRDDPVFFAANYLNDPTAEQARDFKDSWVHWYYWDTPFRVRYRDLLGDIRYVQLREFDTLIAVDPAIVQDARADRTGIIVSGSLDGKHHIILEASAERMGILDTIKTIEDLNRRYHPRRIYIESVAYQKALAQILASKGLPIEEFKVGTSKTKEMRIRALEPFLRQGFVYFNEKQFELLKEYRSFPRGKHDDLLDALSFLEGEWSRLIGHQHYSTEARRKADNINIEKIRNWSYGNRRSKVPSVSDFDYR